MHVTKLGRSGLTVSRLCLGTMNFGTETTEADSLAIMDRSLELGINFIDTANVYGWKLGQGVTEQIVGRWLSQGGGRREAVVLATKVFGRMGAHPTEKGLSALHIRKACEASLRRLQTDHIDLYQMHHIDRSTPWDEVWQAMELLVAQGKVIYVGSSNFAGWHIAQAQSAAQAKRFLGLVSEQSLYNLNARTIELEVIPACRAYGLGLLPYSPLAGGLLGGFSKSIKTGRRTRPDVQKELKASQHKVRAYESFCRKLGEEPAAVALAWLLQNPIVTAPIIGPRTLQQLEGAVRALRIRLGKAELARLDAIWPGPGGEAPEAYAW